VSRKSIRLLWIHHLRMESSYHFPATLGLDAQTGSPLSLAVHCFR
jgi:hypothetical protein